MMIQATHWWVMIAQVKPLDPPPLNMPVVIVVIGVLSLLGAGILVLTFIKLWMDVVGKRTSATVKIEAHTEAGSKDKEPSSAHATLDISGFVATKDFDQHKEETRLRTLGLEKQISESRHDWQREIQGILAIATDRDETATEWRTEISSDMKGTREKLAAVKQQADMIQATQHNMDQKLDRLVERHIPLPTR